MSNPAPVVIGPATLWQGDCLAVMPTLAADSLDAIVTDPPYGLVFMGQSWDHGIPGPAFWVEALRVAKPGAHLLAFGGSRTFHRLVCAIEDAGWEVRDVLMWVYGQGFPKSLNIGCQCTGSALPYTHEQHTEKAESQAKRDLHSLRDPDVSQAVDSCERGREVLQSRLPKQGAPTSGWQEFPATGLWSGEPGMEGRGDLLAQARQLQADQICSLSSGVFADGAEGRLHHGTPSHHGNPHGPVSFENGSGASHQPRSPRQQDRELGTFLQQCGTQAGGVAPSEVCPACGKLKQWAGWGTALKPAYEPILLARKPLAGTVASNVLAHGCGALNIDGCRVAKDSDDVSGWSKSGSIASNNRSMSGPNYDREPKPDNAGRFPANFIHDGSPEVVALFPETTSGSHKEGAKITINGGKGYAGGVGAITLDRDYIGDTGSAARFFYTAKASKDDRDEGLDNFEKRQAGHIAIRANDEGNWSAAKNPNHPRANHHPTVKPTSLMRYLCRLITPPDGLILDPFMGSGSTGKAALLEGFRFVGIEQDPEYLAIAAARVRAAHEQPKQMDLLADLPAPAPFKPRQAPIAQQTPLFEADA